MALTFTTTKMVAPAQESCDLSKLDLLNATESLNQAWMDLTDAQREIDGLQEIMDNVTQSVELLTKFGADAIPMLNQDGGLESLLQIPERLITVEKAQEGLGEAAKMTLNKIIEFIRNLYTRISNFFKSLVDNKEAFDRMLGFDQIDQLKEALKNGSKIPSYFSGFYTIENARKLAKLDEFCLVNGEECADILDKCIEALKRFDASGEKTIDPEEFNSRDKEFIAKQAHVYEMMGVPRNSDGSWDIPKFENIEPVEIKSETELLNIIESVRAVRESLGTVPKAYKDTYERDKKYTQSYSNAYDSKERNDPYIESVLKTVRWFGTMGFTFYNAYGRFNRHFLHCAAAQVREFRRAVKSSEQPTNG